jgi:hypothetical protein
MFPIKPMAALTEGIQMRRTRITAYAAPATAALMTLLLTAACGSVSVSSDSDKSRPDTAKAPAVDTSAGKGDWFLGMQAAGGADGEKSTTTYITFNPSTGEATARRLPGVEAGSASPEQAALLVSTNRQWAIPDTEISHTEENSGQLHVYSLATGKAKVIDIRRISGDSGLKAIGWAFDPQRPQTLRVVDTKNHIWALDVAGGKATQEGSLPRGPWVFTNGFNRNSGAPYVESIDSDATKPAGNGDSDTSAVTRSGGTVLPAGAKGLTALPANPCRLGAGFTDAHGVTWVFCADKPTVSTYYLAKDGTTWKAYGKPSSAVAPVAAGFTLVLPPAQ